MKKTVKKETGAVSREMTLGEIVSEYPQAIETIQSYGLHCVGCHVAFNETLQDGAAAHGLSAKQIDSMLKEINQKIKKESAEEPDSDSAPIQFTKKALQKVKEFQQQQKKTGQGLRFGVMAGGCAGYRYALAFEEKPSKEDVVLESQGIKLFVEKEQLPLVKGCKIDFVETLEGSGFKVNNPNAAKTCGCGQSFSEK